MSNNRSILSVLKGDFFTKKESQNYFPFLFLIIILGSTGLTSFLQIRNKGSSAAVVAQALALVSGEAAAALPPRAR